MYSRQRELKDNKAGDFIRDFSRVIELSDVM